MSTFTAQYRTTIYAPRSDDPLEATVLAPIAGAAHSDSFKIATATVAGYKTYMGMLEGRRGRIDLLSKQTDTGEMTIPVLDVRAGTVTDNLTRWMTAFLGDALGVNRLGGCLVIVEESLDGGATWTAYYTGRVLTVRLREKLWYEIVVRDRAEEHKGTAFLGKPHPSIAYAQLISLWPLGFTDAYGTVPVTAAAACLVANNDATLRTAHLKPIPATLGRLDNLVVRTLVRGINPHFMEPLAQGFSQLPNSSATPNFDNQLVLHLKRLDNSNEGDFRVGLVYGQGFPMPQFLANRSIRFFQRITGLVIQPLQHPKGVATGTPLINNGGGYAAGTTSIATDGWTISVTGILKQGDVISFAGHGTRYVVAADANSNGSGQATIVLSQQRGIAGLTASVADNEALTVQTMPGYLALPPDATSVEVSLRVNDVITEENPLLINDVHPAQLWKDLLDGKFGYLWRPGEVLPPGKNFGDPKRVFGYDGTAFTNLIADDTIPKLRVVITKQLPMNEFIERYICKPYGLGYFFDGQGRVVPVDLRLPTSLAGVGTIGDADLDTRDALDWEYASDEAITVVRGIRYLETFTQPIVDRLGGDGDYPVVTNKLFESAAVPSLLLNFSRDNIGDQEYTIDALGLRAMPNETIGLSLGASVVSQNRAIWAENVLFGLMRQLNRPFGVGPMRVAIPCRRTANVTDCFPGSLKLCTASALPDPATNLRGGTRVLRCLERREQKTRILLTFIDLGLNTFATVPTVGAPAQRAGDTKHGATIAVTLNASGQAVQVDYAVTDTSVGSRPADTDSVWTYRDIVQTSQTVTVVGLPTGKRVWFRARTFPLFSYQLPSAWVYPSPNFIDLATHTAPSGLSVSSITGSTADLAWTNGDAHLFVSVWLVTPTTDPVERIARLGPGTTRFKLERLAISTNYKVEIRHEDKNGGQSAGVNTTFSTTGSLPAAPMPRLVGVLRGG